MDFTCRNKSDGIKICLNQDEQQDDLEDYPISFLSRRMIGHSMNFAFPETAIIKKMQDDSLSMIYPNSLE